jgi:hypothetical protein
MKDTGFDSIALSVAPKDSDRLIKSAGKASSRSCFQYRNREYTTSITDVRLPYNLWQHCYQAHES